MKSMKISAVVLGLAVAGVFAQEAAVPAANAAPAAATAEAQPAAEQPAAPAAAEAAPAQDAAAPAAPADSAAAARTIGEGSRNSGIRCIPDSYVLICPIAFATARRISSSGSSIIFNIAALR